MQGTIQMGTGTTTFDHLKLALTQTPVLAQPQPAKPYVLYTDESEKAIAAILIQKDNQGNERVISYVSHKLSGTQLRWSTIEKEAHEIIYALKKLHPYLHHCTSSLNGHVVARYGHTHCSDQ